MLKEKKLTNKQKDILTYIKKFSAEKNILLLLEKSPLILT